MKVTIDPEADALYMRLSDKRIKDTGEVKPGIILDYDDKNNLVMVLKFCAYQSGYRQQP